MIHPADCNDANSALQESPVGGYAYISAYTSSLAPDRLGKLYAILDGDFSREDLQRIVQYMEQIEEDSLK